MSDVDPIEERRIIWDGEQGFFVDVTKPAVDPDFAGQYEEMDFEDVEDLTTSLHKEVTTLRARVAALEKRAAALDEVQTRMRVCWAALRVTGRVEGWSGRAEMMLQAKRGKQLRLGAPDA